MAGRGRKRAAALGAALPGLRAAFPGLDPEAVRRTLELCEGAADAAALVLAEVQAEQDRRAGPATKRRRALGAGEEREARFWGPVLAGFVEPASGGDPAAPDRPPRPGAGPAAGPPPPPEPPTTSAPARTSELKAHQRAGVEWLLFNRRQGRGCILADEMGLGKTAQAATFLERAHRAAGPAGAGPALVVVPLSVLGTWRRELAAWAPGLRAACFHAPREEREALRARLLAPAAAGAAPFEVLVTSYEIAQADQAALQKVRWAQLVVDEAHRLKNAEGRLIAALAAIAPGAHRVLLTGTPLQNDTDELWSLLHFIDAAFFSSREKFLAKFGDVRRAAQVDALLAILRPYLLRRVKADVLTGEDGTDLVPPRLETLVDVPMAPLQKCCYRALLERSKGHLVGGSDTASLGALRNLAMQLQKCCNHPFLLAGVEAAVARDAVASPELLAAAAGKLQFLDQLLAKLAAEGRRVLIFSTMTRVLDLLEDFLLARGLSFARLDGSTGAGDRERAVETFRAPGGPFAFLLSTRAGGLGLTLVEADAVVLFDSDWNPQVDAQAIARCHRIGQRRRVEVFRLCTTDSYEGRVLATASRKLGLERALFAHAVEAGDEPAAERPDAAEAPDSYAELERMLREGAYGCLTAADGAGAEPLEAVLARSVAREVGFADGPDEAVGGALSKASFVPTGELAGVDVNDPDFWDKILPDAAPGDGAAACDEAALAEASRKALLPRRGTIWSWPERKRLLSALAALGAGPTQWARILEKSGAGAKGKTAAQVAAFACHCVLEAQAWLPHAQLEFNRTIVAARRGVEALRDADVFLDGTADTRDACFDEPKFKSFLVERMADDLPKLEALQPLLNLAASGAVDGGPTGAWAAAASTEEARGRFAAALRGADPRTLAEGRPPRWATGQDVDLLLGVAKHGLQAWKKIREDAAFAFGPVGRGPPDENAAANPQAAPGAEAAAKPAAVSGAAMGLRFKRLGLILTGNALPPAEPQPKPKPKPKPTATKRPPARPAGDPAAPGKCASKGPGRLARLQADLAELPRHAGTGEVVFPLQANRSTVVEALGTPSARKGFHSASYILPVGYRSRRTFARVDDPARKTEYTQEILESPDGPVFRVTAQAGRAAPVEAKSATGAWKQILTEVMAARGPAASKTAISGPEFYGFTIPLVKALIQRLPGALAAAPGYKPLDLGGGG